MFCFVLPMLVVICWVIGACLNPGIGIGGMGLKQPREKVDQDLDDMRTCQFIAFLHAFILNRDLNRLAISRLIERMHLYTPREDYWGPVIGLLSHENAYEKLMEDHNYLPVEVFNVKLTEINRKMQDLGGAEGRFNIWFVILCIMQPENDNIVKDRRTNLIDIMSNKIMTTLDGTSYYVYGLNMLKGNVQKLNPRDYLPRAFIVGLFQFLHINDFECLFFSYGTSVTAHTYCITKTGTNQYSYNNDSRDVSKKYASLIDLQKRVLHDILDKISYYEMLSLRLTFITKTDYSSIARVAHSNVKPWIDDIFLKIQNTPLNIPYTFDKKPKLKRMFIDSFFEPSAEVPEKLFALLT